MNKDFISEHAMQLLLGISISELADAYGIVLVDVSAFKELMTRVLEDLTNGTYMDMPYKQ